MRSPVVFFHPWSPAGVGTAKAARTEGPQTLRERERPETTSTPVHHHGEVGGHGTRGSVMGVRDETSPGGPAGPTADSTPATGKVRLAGGEVGAVHNSGEGGNDAGAKGPYLVDEKSAGQDEAMAAPFEEIATPLKARKLQRTLYRKAKEDKRWRAWSLYADLCRGDVLETALRKMKARSNVVFISLVLGGPSVASASAVSQQTST